MLKNATQESKNKDCGNTIAEKIKEEQTEAQYKKNNIKLQNDRKDEKKIELQRGINKKDERKFVIEKNHH